MTTPDKNPQTTARYRLISRSLVIVVAIALAFYDTFPAINSGRGDTISEGMRDWSRAVWSLPFMWGALTGHFFINTGQRPAFQALFFTLAFVLVVAAGINAWTHFGLAWTAPMWFRVAALFVGMFLGVGLWSQDA